jgi:hypothetical protein
MPRTCPGGTSCHIDIPQHQFNLRQPRFSPRKTLPQGQARFSTMADLFALLPEMGIGFALGFLVVQSASF